MPEFGAKELRHARSAIASADPWPLLRRHQFSDSWFEDLVLALVGLCNRLIVFIRREPGNCRSTILEFTDQQHIAHAESGKLVRFLATLAVVLF